MHLVALSPRNLRRGVFCARGEAGNKMLDRLEGWLKKGILRGQVALSDQGEAIGFILYYPIDTAPLEVAGENFYAIQCVYVRPDQGKKGIGQKLVEAAAKDAEAQGVGGLAVEGFSFPTQGGFEFMPKAFFLDVGFKEVASRGPASLLFKAVRPGARPPSYLKESFRPPMGAKGLRIDLLNCDRCWVGISNNDIVRRLAKSYGDRVEVHEHDQNTRPAVLEKGQAVGIFLDGENVFFGPPITEEQAKAELEQRLQRG